MATSTPGSTKKFFLPITFQTTAEGKHVIRMVLYLGIQPPHQSSWKRRRSRCSRTGQPSHQAWTLLSMYGERRKQKLGKWSLDESWWRILMNSGSPATLLSMLFQINSPISYLSHCWTLYCTWFLVCDKICAAAKSDLSAQIIWKKLNEQHNENYLLLLQLR